MTTAYSTGHFAISSSALSGRVPAALEFYQQLKSSVSWKQLYLLISLCHVELSVFMLSAIKPGAFSTSCSPLLPPATQEHQLGCFAMALPVPGRSAPTCHRSSGSK